LFALWRDKHGHHHTCHGKQKQRPEQSVANLLHH
jgi:hypothetical protein